MYIDIAKYNYHPSSSVQIENCQDAICLLSPKVV